MFPFAYAVVAAVSFTKDVYSDADGIIYSLDFPEPLVFAVVGNKIDNLGRAAAATFDVFTMAAVVVFTRVLFVTVLFAEVVFPTTVDAADRRKDV